MSESADTILLRLKLQNAAATQAGLAGVGASVKGLGDATAVTGKKTALASAETLAGNKGLYLLRRGLLYGTTAVGAMAAGAVKLGWTFDEAKKSGTGAFTALLGSATLARREMDTLVGATHRTGLQLTTLTDAAERMQGFGFSTRQINQNALAIGNYAQRAGLGAAGFSSLVDVFDRVKQKGSFSSLDVRALTAQGVPALQILRRELHLTAAQYLALQKGKLSIPARFALPALTAGLGARANLLGTNVQQQVGVAHSFLSQIFGTGEKQSFSFATRSLQTINSLLERAAAGQKTGGMRGLLVGLDPSRTLLTGWTTLSALMHDAGDTILFVWRVTLPLRRALVGVGWLLGDVAKHTTILNWAMRLLAGWYVVTRTRMLLLAGAEKILAFWTWAGSVAWGAYGRVMLIANGEIAAALGLTTALAGGLAVLAGIGLITLGVELVLHGGDINDWFRKHIPGLPGIQDWTETNIPGLRWLNEHTPGFKGASHVPASKVRGLAGGGSVLPGGIAWVGEGGAPELLRNVGGVAHVTPTRRRQQVQPLHAGVGADFAKVFQPIIEFVMEVDGEKFMKGVTSKAKTRAAMGEAVFAYVGTVRANT